MVRNDKFIILDRDGVINYESRDYIKSPQEWLPIPGSLEAIIRLNQAGYTIVVATNQSGVGRGYYTEAMLGQIHQKMADSLSVMGGAGAIDKIFYCPHHPDVHCRCRKPEAGLFRQIAETYQLDLSNIFSIGDSLRDIQAAQTAGCRPILVLTGNGKKTLKENQNLCKKIPVFSNLLTAVNYLIKEKR